MGQALQKLRGGGPALRGGAAPPWQHASRDIDPVRPSPSPQTLRQSVEVRSEAPEPRKCEFLFHIARVELELLWNGDALPCGTSSLWSDSYPRRCRLSLGFRV